MKKIFDYYYMTFFYYSCCWTFIDNKSEEAKLKMALVIFLVQHESIKENDKYSMIPYKIYIEEGNVIKVRYVSDMFNINKVSLGWGRTRFLKRDKMVDRFVKRAKKYERRKIEVLREEVDRIISSEQLNPKYFEFGTYNDKLMRMLVRQREYKAYGKEGIISLFLYMVPAASLIMMPAFIVLFLITDIYLYFSRGFVAAFALLIIILPYYPIFFLVGTPWIWFKYKAMTTPTPYEIETGGNKY